MNRRVAITLASSVALWAASCGGSQDPVAPPNLILISVDSLRADHLGCYGYERATSPNIDRLAAEGTLVEVATSSSSWTLPAHASMFTGLPDSVHGVDRGARKLEPARRTLAEALSAAGYRTAGVWTGPLLSPRFGFGQGFDRYVSHAAEVEDWQEAVDRSHREVTGPRVLEKVQALLPFLNGDGGGEDAPFFLFVHLWDVHYDYVPPAPFAGRFTDPEYSGDVTGRDLTDLVLYGGGQDLSEADLAQLTALYDGEIAWTDHQIGKLLDILDAAGALDDSVVVVTADHGEEFFEHGRFGHKRQLFDESIRIPLVFWGPGHVAIGRRIDRPARVVDIAPTLLELGGGAELPSVMGRALQVKPGQSRDASPTSDGRAITELVRDSGTDRSLLAVRTREWKLVLRPESSTPVGLWDLVEDPEEQINLVDRRPELLDVALGVVEEELSELRRLRRLHPRADQTESDEALSADLRAQLESLGYLDPEVEESRRLLWVEPNPLPLCDGSELGVVTVHWQLPEQGEVEIRVGSAAGKLFVHGGRMGQMATGQWAREGTRFTLTDRASGEVLASTVVRSTAAGCPGR